MAIVFLVVFLFLLGSSEAFASAATTKALFQPEQFLTAKEHQKAHGDPEKCNKASDEANSPRFKKCEDIFFDYVGRKAPPAVVSQFCNDNCGSFLSTVQQTIMAECDIPVIKTRSYVTDVLFGELCDRKDETHNTTCLETLPALMDPETLNEDYENCLTSFTGLGCPDACKTAEHWVIETVGCCYRAIADYLLWHDNAEIVMHPDTWTMCGMKEPPRCGSP